MMQNTDESNGREDTKGGAARTLCFLLFGPIIWGAHHVLMYASHTALCALGSPGSTLLGFEPMRAISAAATAVALGLIVAIVLAPQPISRFLRIQQGPDWRFYRSSAAVLALLSAAGVAWTGAMAFYIPACVSLR
jgi:hypothetical protein